MDKLLKFIASLSSEDYEHWVIALDAPLDDNDEQKSFKAYHFVKTEDDRVTYECFTLGNKKINKQVTIDTFSMTHVKLEKFCRLFAKNYQPSAELFSCQNFCNKAIESILETFEHSEDGGTLFLLCLSSSDHNFAHSDPASF